MANPTSRAPRTKASPAPKGPVNLNLDTLEREGDVPPPFVFQLGGRRIELKSTADVDWQTLYLIQTTDSPYLFFENVIDEADQEHFLSQKVAGWKLRVLMQQYREHYSLDEEQAGN